MDDTVDSRRRHSPLAMVLIAVIAAPLVLFLPLVLAIIEEFTFGTDRVYEFCQALGVADFLSWLYRPVERLLNYLF